jgi:hypothetical protein
MNSLLITVNLKPNLFKSKNRKIRSRLDMCNSLLKIKENIKGIRLFIIRGMDMAFWSFMMVGSMKESGKMIKCTAMANSTIRISMSLMKDIGKIISLTVKEESITWNQCLD